MNARENRLEYLRSRRARLNQQLRHIREEIADIEKEYNKLMEQAHQEKKRCGCQEWQQKK